MVGGTSPLGGEPQRSPAWRTRRRGPGPARPVRGRGSRSSGCPPRPGDDRWLRGRIMSEPWDREVDFLVVGSGGGGMTAALAAADAGLDALIIDKSRHFGGTTGMSGGGVWVPGNPTLRRSGQDDAREAVRTNLRLIPGGRTPGARIDAFVV